MTGSVEERKAALREEYGYFPDAQERFEYIISKSKALPPLPSELKNDSNFVKGCVSGLWLVPELQDGRCLFRSDADSVITKGIAALVCDMYSGLTPQEIVEFDPAFLDELGIAGQLSPNRRNGLSMLTQKISAFAKTHL